MGKPGFVDYYRVLDISPDATNDEIRAAYRRMAMLVHPDRNKNDPEALEHMTMVNKAWEVLGNEDNRNAFDLLRFEFLASQWVDEIETTQEKMMIPKNAQKLIEKADQALYAAYREIKNAQKIHRDAVAVLDSDEFVDYEGKVDDVVELLDATALLTAASTMLTIMIDADDLIYNNVGDE